MKLSGYLKNNWQLLLRIAFFVAMGLTVAFIFYNSCLPPEQSSEQSGAVGDFIATIIPPDTDLGSFILTYLRKIAHFTEYGLLGIEIAIYVCIFEKKKKYKAALRALIIPLVVGFLDESIQIFSDRGPLISDVWIDVGGFITFSLLAYAAMFLGSLLYKFIMKLRQESGAEREAL